MRSVLSFLLVLLAAPLLAFGAQAAPAKTGPQAVKAPGAPKAGN